MWIPDIFKIIYTPYFDHKVVCAGSRYEDNRQRIQFNGISILSKIIIKQ